MLSKLGDQGRKPGGGPGGTVLTMSDLLEAELNKPGGGAADAAGTAGAATSTAAAGILGWFCTYTPEEILLAAGLDSRRIFGTFNYIRSADAYLGSNLCPYVRSCLEGALRGSYGELDGVIMTTSCNAMCHLYNAWRRVMPGTSATLARSVTPGASVSPNPPETLETPETLEMLVTAMERETPMRPEMPLTAAGAGRRGGAGRGGDAGAFCYMLNVPRLAGGHEDHTAGGAGAVKGKEAGGVGAAGVEIRLEAGAEAEASAGAGIGAGELVLEFWERELRRLMEALSSRFGAVFTEEGLFKAIETCNETRELLYSVYRLNSYYGYFDSSFPGSSSSSRSSESPGYFESPGSFASSGSFGSSGSSGFSGPPGYPGDPDSPGPGCGDGAVSAAAISGVDVIKIVKMSMSYPKSRFNAALKGLLARFSCPRERPREATGRQSGPHSSHSRPRILVAGSVCDVPVLEIIEDAGARVVADDLCVGMRYVLDRVDMDEAKRGGNLVRAIAKRYLNKVPCARMHHAASRFERVSKLAREFDVDGVIFYGLKFCDPYLYDHVTLRRALEANGIPVLFLEGDYTAGGAGQARTRVEAFVEMIGS